MPAAQLSVLLFEIKTFLITLGCIPSAVRWEFSSVDVCFTHTLEGGQADGGGEGFLKWVLQFDRGSGAAAHGWSGPTVFGSVLKRL